MESVKTLVFANIRFILKFERGHLERGRFMRLARHLMGWRLLAFRQICSEVYRVKHILFAAKMLRGLYFLTIQVLWGYSVGFPEKGERQTGQVFSLLSHMLFSVH